MSGAVNFDVAHATYLRARAELALANAAAGSDEVWPSLFETERAAAAQVIRAPVRYREHMAAKLSLLRQRTDEEGIGGAFMDDRVRALALQVSSDFADLPEPPTMPEPGDSRE